MERPDISRFVHPILLNLLFSAKSAPLTGDSALGTKMVVLRAASQEKVYVHKALLGDEIASVGACKWSCFPRDTVKNFIEYLYQGDYTDPPVALSFDASSSAGEERHE